MTYDPATAAEERFLARLAESYPVVRIPRPRCPRCKAVARGRPQHSERDGEMSVQRRKCQVCATVYIAIVD